jgi:GNAT superfamily N-acetyltransferase
LSVSDETLRELAANRGCRLVKSRRRKPGTGDYGRYGLKDAATGRQIFGFGSSGLTAHPEEIESFLRGTTAATWKNSVGAVPVKARRDRIRREAEEAAASKGKPEKPGRREKPDKPAKRDKAAKQGAPEKREKPVKADIRQKPKVPGIREARPRDAGAIAALLAELGYEAAEKDVTSRLARLRKSGEPLLVAESDRLVGCIGWHVTQVVHRPKPVGRITLLVVAESGRGQGAGRLLVEAAEERLAARGCGFVEVTSNLKRSAAHRFYNHLGFDRTSYRFMKPLPDSDR